VSKMTLTTACPRHACTTPSTSLLTVSRSPDLSAPTLITMSISVAPLAIASRASAILTKVLVAPKGNPTTVVTPTLEPDSVLAARRTQYGLTHTVANPYVLASSHNRTISAAVTSGFNKV